MINIYLIDYNGEYYELDCEDVDFGLEFKASDLNDISIRSGNRTKDITIKGTQKNNLALGHIFRITRMSDLELDNKVAFNFNSLRPVDCLVYKNNILLFKGSFRVIEIEGVDKILYKCVITDSTIDFVKTTQEKYLTDLDLSDLKHRYNFNNIISSWDEEIEVWNETEQAYNKQPFGLGYGYTYPTIYYGITPSTGTTQSGNIFSYDIENFRPALYVREIVDRIFKQSGYTWRLSSDGGSASFNSLIIPNNQESFSSKVTRYQERLYHCGTQSLVTTQLVDGEVYSTEVFTHYAYANMPCSQQLGASSSKIMYQFADVYPEVLNPSDPNSRGGYAIWIFNNDIKTTIGGTISCQFNNVSNGDSVFLKVLTRKGVNNEPNKNLYINTTEWDTIWTYGFTSSSSLTQSFTASVDIGDRQYNKYDEIVVLFQTSYNAFSPKTIGLSINSQLLISKTPQEVNAGVIYNNDVTPTLPENIKQYDFLKSLMLMFNLYAYVNPDNSKEIIFSPYDTFYNKFGVNIVNNALDWTNKIAYNEPWKKVLNASLPKSYLYTFKDDKDYINEDYKNSNNSAYGSLTFNDQYGITDQRKVELIFSPSPQSNFYEILCPRIYKTVNGVDSRISSNIRILHFNGKAPINEKARSIYDGAILLTYRNPFVSPEEAADANRLINVYGYASEYYVKRTIERVVISVLQFGLPIKTYFPVDDNHLLAPNLYSQYYIGQITELTNPNISTIECSAYLTELDISNFDLRTPIFIQSPNGNSYYKVIELSWNGSNTPSKLKLQSVDIGITPTTTTSTTTTTTTAYVPPPTTTTTTLAPVTISYSYTLFDATGDFSIIKNGVEIVNSTSNTSGSFTANIGDSIEVYINTTAANPLIAESCLTVIDNGTTLYNACDNGLPFSSLYFGIYSVTGAGSITGSSSGT